MALLRPALPDLTRADGSLLREPYGPRGLTQGGLHDTAVWRSEISGGLEVEIIAQPVSIADQPEVEVYPDRRLDMTASVLSTGLGRVLPYYNYST